MEKTIVLKLETPNGMQDVALRLTRFGILDAERRGILDIEKAQKAPISYFYALAYAAVLQTVRNAKQSTVDEAIERYFNEKDEFGVAKHTFEEFSSVLMEQYKELFGTADASGLD